MVEVCYQPRQALLAHEHLIAYETAQEFNNKHGMYIVRNVLVELCD